MIRRWMVFAMFCALIVAAGCGRSRPQDDGAAAPGRSEAELRAANREAGAAGTLMPIDEAGGDPGFEAFRAGLVAAVERRDSAAVLAALDPHIRWSFGDDTGIEGFRARWFGDDPPADLWEELGEVLSLGGTFAGDTMFVAPYTFSRWPSELDSYSHVVVTAADVPLRAAPLPDAEVLAEVSHAIYLLDSNRQLALSLDGWTPVDRGTGTPGFIESRHVRLPLDYRAYFQRRGGEWRMAMFLAGD